MDGVGTAWMTDGQAGLGARDSIADDVFFVCSVQATSELAATYAALILADDNVEITVRTSTHDSGSVKD